MRLIDWILPLNVKIILKNILKKKEVNLPNNIEELKKNPLLEKSGELINSVDPSRSCYILACGPSINEMDLSKVKGKDCISVSNFFVHPSYNEIKPKYHVFAPTHEPITEEQYSSWIADFFDKTNFDIKLFLNAIDCNITDKVPDKKEIDRYYYEITARMPELFDCIQFDQPLPRIQTVVHIALYVAISLGYQKIHLLGIDHNWILNFGKTIHFYDESDSKLSNLGYVEYNKTVDLEKEFESQLSLWKIYKSILKYSKRNNIEIYNSTPKSLLDVFPNKNL
jgi:hypothetical protein